MNTTHVTTLLLLAAAASCGGRDSAASDGAATPGAAAPGGPATTVSFTGVGPVQFGISRSALLQAVGAPAEAEAPPQACEYLKLPTVPLVREVGFLIVKDSVVRVDVDSASSAATEWGDRIGDAEAVVLSRHAGNVRTEPHKYTGPIGHYLIVTTPGDTIHELIFETDGLHVTKYRAGRKPQVEWTERCG